MTTDSVLCWILGRTVFALRATLGLSVNRDWLSTTLGATRLPSWTCISFGGSGLVSDLRKVFLKPPALLEASQL